MEATIAQLKQKVAVETSTPLEQGSPSTDGDRYLREALADADAFQATSAASAPASVEQDLLALQTNQQELQGLADGLSLSTMTPTNSLGTRKRKTSSNASTNPRDSSRRRVEHDAASIDDTNVRAHSCPQAVRRRMRKTADRLRRLAEMQRRNNDEPSTLTPVQDAAAKAVGAANDIELGFEGDEALC